MKQKILISLIIAIFALGFLATKEAKAGAGDNVYGWAWSDNIGWISFNSTDTIGPINYGVDIDPANGSFSGYAWSRGTDVDIGGVGWITFADFNADGIVNAQDRTIAGSPCIPNCEAEIDLTNCPGNLCPVSGWARALAPIGNPNAGGWDGWIKLSGTIPGISNYGVSLDISAGPPYEFKGWAWGGDDTDEEAVIGWISFNCFDRGACGFSDYKVMTNIILDSTPYITSTSWGNECTCASTPTGSIGFQWIYTDDEGDDQSEYQLEIARDLAFNNIVITRTIIQPIVINPGGTGTGTAGVNVKLSPGENEIAYGESYYWRVKVKSNTGDTNWSNPKPDPPELFTTPSHPLPNPSFTPDQTNPSPEVEVTFIDSSTCYTATEAYACQNNTYGLLVSYGWDFDGDSIIDEIVFPPNLGDATYTYPAPADYAVRLEVTDNIGMCDDEYDLGVGLPPPTWIEVPPF